MKKPKEQGEEEENPALLVGVNLGLLSFLLMDDTFNSHHNDRINYNKNGINYQGSVN
jgi:hypothetical protein